ncbi:MAG: hypothetical protein ABI874_05060 [Chloroflexota bacterium]
MSAEQKKSQIPNPKIKTGEATSDGLAMEDEGRQTGTSGAQPASPVSRPPSKAEPLELPKGALIAYRKSGGLKFSSREVVVYPDGRVTYGGGDKAKTALTRASRKLNDAQVTKLRRTLDSSGFWQMNPPEGKHGGDAFAHELVSRVGPKHNQFEVFTGAIPDALTALIEQMEKLLPSEE